MEEQRTENLAGSLGGQLACTPTPNTPMRNAAVAGTSTRISAPALRFDWSEWLSYLEDEDASDAQKRELIESLWSIVVAFVDFGWRVDANPETGNALDLRAILTRIDTEKEAE